MLIITLSVGLLSLPEAWFYQLPTVLDPLASLLPLAVRRCITGCITLYFSQSSKTKRQYLKYVWLRRGKTNHTGIVMTLTKLQINLNSCNFILCLCHWGYNINVFNLKDNFSTQPCPFWQTWNNLYLRSNWQNWLFLNIGATAIKAMTDCSQYQEYMEWM